MTSLTDLKTSAFTIGDLLTLEAEQLCRASPVKGTPKAPNASTSLLTQQSKSGFGPGHSVVRPWPSEKLPTAWGQRNRAVLLEETISPSIWKILEGVNPSLSYLKFRTLHSLLPSMRSNDNGNEPAFRDIGQKLLTRIMSIALLVFLNHWSKHQTHKDFLAAVQTLHVSDIKVEYTSEDSDTTIIHDIAALVARRTPIPILKELAGTSEGAVLTMLNNKSTGNSQFKYQGFTSESFGRTVQTVDQCIQLAVEHSSKSLEPLSIAKLNEFLAEESKFAWPQMAASHLAQVRFFLELLFVSCLVCYGDDL